MIKLFKKFYLKKSGVVYNPTKQRYELVNQKDKKYSI